LEVDILYFEGCPHYEPALELVRDVVEDLGVDAVLSEIEIKSHDEASSRSFLGSPTIRVNGEDIEISRRQDENYALSCRRYGESGVPPRDLVVAALSGGHAA